MKVAVFGASGFVGATLVERLWHDSVDVRPIIHSSGNAARLARFGRPLVVADVLSPDAAQKALAGCTHVVNCSRGPSEVMIRGLSNILEASHRAGIRRFVHLSSVAVYGDSTAGTLAERTVPRPSPNTYGSMKLRQDELVVRAAAKGLSAAILCPPNIGGSYSAFLLEIVQAIRKWEFALVGDGTLPCELVDVENLVHAIRLALAAPVVDAQRIFVTDGVALTWRQLAESLTPLAERPLPLQAVPEHMLTEITAERPPESGSLRSGIRQLVSSEVRSALKKDPWLAEAEKRLKSGVRLVPGLEKSLRRRLEEKLELPNASSSPYISERLIRQQLRNTRYSLERVRSVLGYEPVTSPTDSLKAFSSWYSACVGWNADSWDLIRELYE
jgi:nucleoside-diphosphate-sugar epimerase